MSQAFAVEEIIGHPAQRVWAALTDWPNAHRWMPGIDTITADGDTAEGTSRVTLTADCQSTGVLWRLMWPLLRIAIRTSDAKQLRLLKAMIEDA